VNATRAAARRRGRRGSRPLLRALLIALATAAVFLFGLGLGRALEENAVDPALRTDVRTLTPVRLPPSARTVTVTVTDDS